ncbi:MAG: DNA-3-methyladenine glycosylase I [Bacteroidales bacterium]|nr:DNA-3-methyladenine glycosylase I [Bacteroidales bacterium]
MSSSDQIIRCEWAVGNPLLTEYHDREWGVPQHDDTRLFENFVLDGFQAGLSWLTILKKREAFRQAFDQFNIQKVAGYSDKKISELLKNEGIIRNRLKIEAAVNNARLVLKIIEEYGSFSNYLWRFVNGKTIVNNWNTYKDAPANSPESDEMSRDMRKRGFTFTGSTICYAFMQAVGIVDDHIVTCFRHNPR